MKRHWAPALFCILIGGLTPAIRAAIGDTETVLSLATGNHPEGIAVGPTGDVFIGNRRNLETARINEILRIAPGEGPVVFARLPDTSVNAESLLGLTTDRLGNVYAALASFDGNHGVWMVSRAGDRSDLIAGSSAIVLPNDLTFDQKGNLYVTDSLGGAIWRAEPGGAFVRWATHPLFAPLPADPFGSPLPGANGIAFFPPDTLYVANTERSLVAKVRIEPDGSAGDVEAVTAAFAVPAIDGLGVDVHGALYGALPGFSVLGRTPLVRIDPVTGVVTAVPADASRFDTPLSLVFAGGPWKPTTVFVTNGDLPLAPGGPGPGVVRVDAGTRGFPGQ